jgi:DNA primase catalytic subunit
LIRAVERDMPQFRQPGFFRQLQHLQKQPPQRRQMTLPEVGDRAKIWRVVRHEIERLIRKSHVADIDAEVDIRLEQVAGLIALDPFTADERGQVRLRREMEKLRTLEQRLLTCADGERPMTFKRKIPGADLSAASGYP